MAVAVGGLVVWVGRVVFVGFGGTGVVGRAVLIAALAAVARRVAGTDFVAEAVAVKVGPLAVSVGSRLAVAVAV